jgi:phage gp46-like protein
MVGTMFFDIALVYDPQTRRCDLALGGDGDLILDITPATPMLLSVGLDRRAAPGDELPAGSDAFLVPGDFQVRRGRAGDALDPVGERVGSRLWLLDRAKQTDQTRMIFAMWLAECLAWVGNETGRPATIAAHLVAPQMLRWRARIDDTEIGQGVRLS